MIKIVFFGTPSIVIHALDALKAAGIVPTLVVTQPDRPAGRGNTITPPPVKTWAEKEGIDVLQPEAITDEFIDELSNTTWDLFIVAAYGMILPEKLLQVPTQGTLNIHPSLLPKLRGPSPVRSAILNDEKNAVGVSIMKLDKEMDHGPILAQGSVELEEWPTRGDILEQLLMHEGGTLLAELITTREYSDASLYIEQDHRAATYCKKLKKEMGEIHLGGDGYKNWLTYNALYGWPGVYYFDGDGKRIKITEAIYEDGVFTPTKIIPEGKGERAFL